MVKKSRKAARTVFIKKVMKNHKKGFSLREAVKKTKSWKKLSVRYLKSPPVKLSRKKRTKKKARKSKRKGRRKTRRKSR